MPFREGPGKLTKLTWPSNDGCGHNDATAACQALHAHVNNRAIQSHDRHDKWRSLGHGHRQNGRYETQSELPHGYRTRSLRENEQAKRDENRAISKLTV